MATCLSVARVNRLDKAEAEEAFLRCCGSHVFASKMANVRPFASASHLVEESRRIWASEVAVSGWLEAFSAHPRIGNVEKLREKFGSTAGWCEGEQAATLQSANEAILQDLAEWNKRYEQKFGHIFIICASGKSSSQVLKSLKERYTNRPIDEIQVAASEQQQITELRLEKLLTESVVSMEPASINRENERMETTTVGGHNDSISQNNIPKFHSLSMSPLPLDRRIAIIASHFEERKDKQLYSPSSLPPNPVTLWGSPTAGSPSPSPSLLRPPITTHVLDSSLGRPASGIEITLHHRLPSTNSKEVSGNFLRSTDSQDKVSTAGGEREGEGEKWLQIGRSKTDRDGRSGPLMTPSSYLDPGTYKLTFKTSDYFMRGHKTCGFYPEVIVTFVVTPSQTEEHFHVPVLLSPYSYTTYRGS